MNKIEVNPAALTSFFVGLALGLFGLYTGVTTLFMQGADQNNVTLIATSFSTVVQFVLLAYNAFAAAPWTKKNSPPSAGDAAIVVPESKPKDGGYVRPGLLSALAFASLAVILISLSGCTYLQKLTGLNPEQQALVSCESYDSAVRSVIALRISGNLSDENLALAKSIDKQVTPVCTSPEISVAASSKVGELIVQMLVLGRVEPNPAPSLGGVQ